MIIQNKNEHLRSVFHNIPRIFFELFQAKSIKEKYLFFYFNLPYLFPKEKFPPKITLEFTNYCNFQCTHCHRYIVNKKRPAGELDVGLFKRIIDELSDYPATILKIGGWGEPAMHPNFKEMLKYSADKKIRTFIFTNGTIFKTHSFSDLLDLTKTVIVISVDGHDQDSYELIRVGGNYQELRNKIKKFYQFRNKNKRKFPKIVVQRVVFPSEKYKELEHYRKLWNSCTDVVDFCVFNPLEKVISNSDNNNSHKRCKRIRRELSILYDGSIPVCGPQTKFTDCEYIGDIRKEPLYDIWNNKRMTQIRELLNKKKFLTLARCRKCIYFR